LTRSVFSSKTAAGGYLLWAVLCLAVGSANAANDQKNNAFGFEQVEQMAARLAEQAYAEPPKIPEFMRHMNYDKWRDIRFKTERSLWRGENVFFEVQFFHPGFLYLSPVKINVVDQHGARPLAYSPGLFNFGMNTFPEKVPDDLGFAGFRVHHPINTDDYYDEVIAFMGASYFRAVAKDQRYGLSARGLALDVAEQKGEEFPVFKEFWIVKPGPDDRKINIYAMLDSPSLCGAYAFVIEPGVQTLVHVKSTLYRRKGVQKLGMAPLTSMFLHGENNNVRHDDFRPEVHDSDGLLIGSDAGEWMWRPLRNPKILSVSDFPVDRLNGFGLLQRDSAFESYQDLEAFYQLRPSVWISPVGNWGPGKVQLIELPTDTEINDNIIAFWVPREVSEPSLPMSFAYRMNWYFPDKDRHEKGWVMATRSTATKDENRRRFLIDFKGGQLARLDDPMVLEPVVSASKGAQIVDQQLMKNKYTDSWRLVFSVVPGQKELLGAVMNDGKTINLKAFLRQEGNAVTETWSYHFEP